jgi:isopentenyl diphosphate isomerase/L-lactate dehydrogenase-like FMN-dependent dehydrogenase
MSCLIGMHLHLWPRGVAGAIEIIRKELGVTMAVTGVRRIMEIDRRVLVS